METLTIYEYRILTAMSSYIASLPPQSKKKTYTTSSNALNKYGYPEGLNGEQNARDLPVDSGDGHGQAAPSTS